MKRHSRDRPKRRWQQGRVHQSSGSTQEMRGIKITEWDAQVRGTEPPAENEDKKIADLLVEMAEGFCEFFHDEDREPYAVFDVDGHGRCGPSSRAVFSSGYRLHFTSSHDRSPSETALKTALPTLVGDAKYSGAMRPVHLRVAKHEDAYWLDLCDDKWRAVRVDKAGWQIVKRPRVMFMRTPSMRALTSPSAAASWKTYGNSSTFPRIPWSRPVWFWSVRPRDTLCGAGTLW